MGKKTPFHGLTRERLKSENEPWMERETGHRYVPVWAFVHKDRLWAITRCRDSDGFAILHVPSYCVAVSELPDDRGLAREALDEFASKGTKKCWFEFTDSNDPMPPSFNRAFKPLRDKWAYRRQTK